MKRAAGILAVLALLAGATGIEASTFYDWVCATPCGDPTFTAFLEISDAAVTAGSFTGAPGNILSAGITSGVGDGFSLDLADLLAGAGSSNDVANISIVFSADRGVIEGLSDVTAGTNITFDDAGGRVDFIETVPYSIQLIQDKIPSEANVFNVNGQFVARTPEPGTLALIVLGLGAVGFAARRRSTKDR